MSPVRRRRFLVAMAVGVCVPSALRAVAKRDIKDDAGRTVMIPAKVERVYGAGPPASMLAFALAPEKLIGWTSHFRPAERPFVPEKYANLPALGRLTGRGNTANVEVVLAAKHPSSLLCSEPTTDRFRGSTESARKFRMPLAVGIAAVALVAIVIVAFTVGQYPVSLGELARLLWARLAGGAGAGASATIAETVIFDVCGPRVLAALLVGGALAASGAAYQTLLRNPLVSPDILGVSAGAALGAVLAIFLSLNIWAIQGFAFGFGLLAVAAAYVIAASLRGHDPILVLVLAGVVLGSLLGACIALVKYLADPYNQLPAITYWLLGNLASASVEDVRTSLVPVLVGLVALWLVRWRITVLSLGDEEAASLGVSAGRIRALVIGAATLVTAAVVSISGIIGWIGLVVPHVARMLVGPDFRVLFPVSVLLGSAFLLGVDTLARTVARIEIPLGVLTAFVGTPIFVWLLATTRRRWQ